MLRNEIALLAKETIDKIAAGEVVERPSSVAKELIENSIDAGATHITVEIVDGGKKLLRVTDNGCGIPKEQCAIAFMRHATSKLRDAKELATIGSLGFRGEALSSIAAVSHVELITKPSQQLSGVKYVVEGGKELALSDIGAPDGTTIVVQRLFYNTPARLKFLKTDATEGSYIADLMERLALSHPEISFSFISNGRQRLHTSGNGKLKDVIYQIYGKQLANSLLPLEVESEAYAITGFVGDATVARGNRNLETFFVAGRYIKSSLLQKALEEGYEGYLMSHQYPFAVLFVTAKSALVDVNVHPTKQEVRFTDEATIYSLLRLAVVSALKSKEDIAAVSAGKDEPELISSYEPLVSVEEYIAKDFASDATAEEYTIKEYVSEKSIDEHSTKKIVLDNLDNAKEDKPVIAPAYEQKSFLSEEALKGHRIIGQVFDTYWLVEFDEKLYLIDQHAAHEKVLYERMMAQLKEKQMTSQMISPPIIVTLSLAEQQLLAECNEAFSAIGFAVEAFGGAEFAINAIPANLYSIDARQLFMDLLAECASIRKNEALDVIKEKVASMSCKAAVKGHNHLSFKEVETLIDDLLKLDNPYHCPHGRPTIISMSKYEIEKKFKRIV